MKEVITIKDRDFELFIEQDVVEQGIKRIAGKMNADLAGKSNIRGSAQWSIHVCRRVDERGEYRE